MTWTILAALNLFCALAAFTFLAHALARLSWNGRGIVLVLFAIIIAAQTWLVPQLLCVFALGSNLILDWCWFANWLVCAVAIVFLWHALKDVPADRFSAARIDGCTALGIYWYVVLPLVRRTLVLLAILILIAIGGFLLAASSRIFQLSSQRPDFVLLVGVSLAASLPLIVLFLLAKKIFPARRSR